MGRRCRRSILYLSCLLLGLVSGCSYNQLPTDENGQSTPINLPVVKVTPRHPPYTDFCRRDPAECRLNGPTTIQLTAETMALLAQTNTRVNNEIIYDLDSEQYNQEEYWTLPRSGRGDCEDIALEKRYRLVRLGLPSAALRLTIAFHKRLLDSHALLTVETDKGTYVMNSTTDEIRAWTQVPYDFVARERADGQWEHFNQSR